MVHFSRCSSLLRVAFCTTFLSAMILFSDIRPVAAALSCNPQSGITTIGLEWVAKQCVPEGMTDSTSIYYENNMLECPGSSVSLYAWYGDTQGTPTNIINYAKSQGYKVFRNKEGSHIVAVHRYYTGLIDGKSMGSYAVGQVYTDIFKEALYPTNPVPDCKGREPDQCKLERQAGSTVNLSTGRLSHSQTVFSLSNSRSLSLGVTLYYRSSSPFAPSAIGNGWSHNYEATLAAGSGSAMVFWNQGVRTVYEKYNTTYISPKGDTSTLVKNADTTWTITELNGLTRTFGSDGRLTSIADRYNNSLTFAYANDKLTSVTDSTGRAVTFGYNATSGKLETITEPETTRVHTLAYPSGRLDTVTPPGNKGQWVYTYGTNGLLETKKDPENNLTRYTYHPDNRLKDATDPNNKPRAYAYPSPTGTAGKVPDAYPVQNVPVKQFNFTEKDGFGWTYTYDTLTMAERTATDPYGKSTTSYYNPDATLRARTVPFDGNVALTTFYTYDANGNLLTETDPVNIAAYTNPTIDPQTVNIASLASRTPPIKTAMSYTYDTAASYYQVKTITDHRGTTPLTTTYDRYTEPDGQGGTWLVTRTTAPGETSGTYLVSYQRQNQNGTLAGTTDANGNTTTYSYYPVDTATIANGTAGMLQTMTTPDGIKLTYTAYDKNGNPTEYKVTGTDNADVPVKTTQEYNSQNLISSLLRESTVQPARFPANLTAFGYDNNGNQSSVIDAEGHPTTYTYTYQGQLSEIIDARNTSTTFDYSGSGCSSCSSGVDKLTAVRDANHIANNQAGTVYTYDKVGRLETETDPLGKKLRYTYYDGGLPKEKYDATAGEPGTLLVTHYYNGRGQLTEKRYADNTSVAFTYKPNGWLETAENRAGTTVTFSYTYDYHANGRLKSVTDSNGRVIFYDEYFAGGQRKKVTYFPTTPDQRIIRYDYDANRPWHIVAPAGTFTYGYDERGRLDSLEYPNTVTAAYDFDDLDRLTALNHGTAGGTTIVANGYPEHDRVGNITARTGDLAATYVYDELYRLTDAVTAKGTEKFTYDDVGNRQTGPGPRDTAYEHNAANQMTRGRTLGFDYDNAGNQTTRTIGNAPDKSWVLTWDYENRLTRVEKTKGAETRTTTFKYDPFGRRIEKKHTTTKGQITKTITTTYVYDEEDIILEITNDGTTATKTFYTHGPGMDEPLALERGGSHYYYHADHLGSIMAITDSAGNVVQSYRYDTFGTPKATTTFQNGYLFTGREWDKETNLYFYRARYYDPMVGKFISKDPAGFVDGPNLYSYVQNNPINLTDPSGLESAGYGGWEAQFIGGYGESTVSCCDGQKLHQLKYRKVCLGAGFTAGVSGGVAIGSQGASCKNPPRYIGGAEFGFPIFGALGGEGGYGVGSGFFAGASAGVGGKVTACFYWLVSNTEKGCCGQ
ncbi:hypothetical protein SE37_06020 [Geobacter soli]|uniref:Uncharacterized protein n=1 Tax=Geobacter soli TaxID=1510391 RepID=A0A0C1TMS8_9BACT|nr:hypothetical protein SE37_06020 [Geobacter soli]